MKRRKRRSQAQWKALVEQQKESDQSVSQFCQQKHLSSKTFYKHRRALQAGKKTARSHQGFIKIKKSSSPQPLALAQPACTLYYQNCTLQIQSNLDASWVAQIIKALS